MSDCFVADTMALVLRLEQRKLPSQSKHLWEQAEQGRIEWSKHAIKRMHQRGVTRHEVTTLMSQCSIVKEYPSVLFRKFCSS